MRYRNTVLLALVTIAGLAILAPPRIAWGLAGKLDRPSIAVPTVGQDTVGEKSGAEGVAGVPDPVCSAIQKVLSEHARQFVSGRFINAHSTLEFSGNTVELNALLKDLAAVEGAKIQIRFSKGTDQLLQRTDPGEDAPPYQWSIEHNAWGDAQLLTVTIFVGDGKIKIEDLRIPTIVGRK